MERFLRALTACDWVRASSDDKRDNSAGMAPFVNNTSLFLSAKIILENSIKQISSIILTTNRESFNGPYGATQ